MIDIPSRPAAYWMARAVAAEAALAAETERCARIAESHTWARDIDWWMNATKKEVSEVSAREVAAAIRAQAST